MNKHTEWPAWRTKLKTFIEDSRVQRFIITLIIINAITLGMETSDDIMSQWGGLILTIDSLILTVFVIEITIRLIVHRLSFFRDPWSVFDFIIVGIALIPASGPLEVLRALRVLRVLRLLTMVPSMKRVVGGMLSALPGLASVAGIMAIIFYIAAVIATNLYKDTFPEWFGSLATSSYTLFQVMTLESWSMGIVRPIMEVHPHAWLFFLPFILVATFTVLNLIMGVIVNAIQEEQHSEFTDTQKAITDNTSAESQALHQEITTLRDEIREIKALLKGQSRAH
ncbi:MAG TPA: ion transporter [Gammaproteobacteria bacterium]|nr:ion transporter [Gammaproteobacteria bacterium]